MTPETYVDYAPRGAIQELFFCRDYEVLLEGPANTGKTRGALEYAHAICERFAGARILFVRLTRKSLSETVLVTFENNVLYPGHPAIHGDAKRRNRASYLYPETGAEIVLAGLDDPENLYSGEFDVIFIFEAVQIPLEKYETLMRATRWKHVPWQQIVCDTNPGPEGHFLNKRARAGLMRRLITRHKDNPTFTAEDQSHLDRMTGTRRRRLRDGAWISEAGQVWDNFDAAIHFILAKDVPKLNWHFGSMDFGLRAPGVLQMWGVDADRRMYRELEVYRTGWSLDKWGAIVEKWYKVYQPVNIVADPSVNSVGGIEMLNDRIGALRDRTAPPCVIEADNAVFAGLNQVRDYLQPDEHAKPVIYLVVDALREGRDETRADERLPTCTEEEIEGYVWTKNVDGTPNKKERPDPKCEDHGCDAMRYAAMYNWKRDHTKRETGPMFEADTLGALLKHEAVIKHKYKRGWSA